MPRKNAKRVAAYGELAAGMPSGIDLSEEIALARQHIQKLAGAAEDDGRATQLMARMLEVLTRMVNVQAKMGEQDGNDLADLNELVRQRLIRGGYTPPPQDARLPAPVAPPAAGRE